MHFRHLLEDMSRQKKFHRLLQYINWFWIERVCAFVRTPVYLRWIKRELFRNSTHEKFSDNALGRTKMLPAQVRLIAIVILISRIQHVIKPKIGNDKFTLCWCKWNNLVNVIRRAWLRHVEIQLLRNRTEVL